MEKICIIGAGISGLCACKYSIEYNLEPTIFEQTNDLGGKWVYSEKTGKDEFGINIVGNMYKNLRTNLPKEIMGLADFDISNGQKSFIQPKDVVEFFHLYAAHYNINQYIKYRHHVVCVRPISQKWEVSVKDLIANKTHVYIFDYILVCNGNFNDEFIPNFVGKNIYLGTQLHSKNYRCPELIKGNNILVIGASASGIDISIELFNYGKSVTLSHEPFPFKININDKIIHKPCVKELTENGVVFVDDTTEQFDGIMYCTGYNFSFPFLHKDCGIIIDDNYVQPLWKQVINIEHPTMGFVMLTYKSLLIQADLQVKFALTFFTGKKEFPSKIEMLDDTENEMEKRWKKGYKKKHAHCSGEDFREQYFNSLTQTAELDLTIKPVYNKMFVQCAKRIFEDFEGFRNDNYKIIDYENFELIQKSFYFKII